MKRTLMVLGSDRLLIAVTELIKASAWFEVTPLPDDYWDVTVKDEHLPIEILSNASGDEKLRR